MRGDRGGVCMEINNHDVDQMLVNAVSDGKLSELEAERLLNALTRYHNGTSTVNSNNIK